MQLLRTPLFVRSFLLLACAALPEQSAYAFPQARTLVPLKKPAATSRALPVLPPKVVAEPPQPSVDPDTPQIETTDGAATTPEDASAAAEKQNRLRALQTMDFDRRPSAILKAWSTSELPVSAIDQSNEDAAEANPLAATTKIISGLQLAVTQGNWTQVGDYLEQLVEDERLVAWNQIVSSLQMGPRSSPKARNGQIIGEKNILKAADILQLAEIYPADSIPEEAAQRVGRLAATCSNEGESPQELEVQLSQHLQQAPPESLIDAPTAVRILFAAGQNKAAASILPQLEVDQASPDAEMLLLIATIRHDVWKSSGSSAELQSAWKATLAALEATAVFTESTEQARPPESPAELETRKRIGLEVLQMAVRIAPLLEDELGGNWLRESFSSEADRGRRIMQGIGETAATSMALMPTAPDQRLDVLKLQQNAVSALLSQQGDSPEDWQTALNLMLINWLREARYSQEFDSSVQRGPSLQRDNFGNYYYKQDDANRQNQARIQSGMPTAINSGKLLDILPDERFLKFLDPAVFPTFASTTATLLLKVQEETEAFPWIEKLAESHPDDAVQLVRTFLETWSTNNDPNSNRRRTGVYMFSFGFNQRLNAIPLTRSHQQRNLQELAGWVQRIRSLQLEGVDDTWIAKAFTSVHSSAEVYQLAELQTVFGDPQDIAPKTMSILLSQMRNNLATLWRSPQVQQNSKTNRRKQEIEAEVVRGYQTAITLCRDALGNTPDEWQLMMQQGALEHDLANYNNDLARSSDFLNQRQQALETLQAAADSYVRNVAELDAKDYSVEPFNTWFYASLGDASIQQITPDRNPLLEQFRLISESMAKIPQASLLRHREMFCNDLFARMSGVNPAVKFRFVREGLQIIGDETQGREARKVFEYYSDLVSEISLMAEIDGPLDVGSDTPFGVLISIRHTRAIEREAGGFSRYLQNQNSGGGYFYNNGRPNEDYRDKFEDAARQALDEHFEVLSVTFEPESVQSIPDDEPGWRKTPYAWILLKSRGPEIDRLPAVRLDLDFLDTTGYVVLPVESPVLSINCSDLAAAAPRPFEQLSITQTLDERMAKQGELLLEVKATARGLVPELDQILQLKFPGCEVVSVDDGQLSVSSFDDSSTQPAVLSERIWNVTLNKAPQTDASTFVFASTQIAAADADVLYQRYNDADLQSVEQHIQFLAESGVNQPVNKTLQAVLAVLMLAAFAVTGMVRFRQKTVQAANSQDSVRVYPRGSVDAFTAAGMLRRVYSECDSSEEQEQLRRAIDQIESIWFSNTSPDESASLEELLSPWFQFETANS